MINGTTLMAAIDKSNAIKAKEKAVKNTVEYVYYNELNRQVIKRLPNGKIRLKLGWRRGNAIIKDVLESEVCTSNPASLGEIGSMGFRPGTRLRL
jgi:hypothetical protein